MNNKQQRAREVFELAIEISDPVERAEFVSERCDGDPEFLNEVEKLLAANEDATGLFRSGGSDDKGDFELASPAGSDGELTQSIGSTSLENADQIIAGRYKLRQNIGEGGMGSVWVAEQFEPVKRKVAIKMIKAGMDSKQVLARFNAERQALALMDHPNIAKVFDGGMTEQGRPYFVMEYVKGIPFTDYCDQARVPLKERLELFIPVCQAIQHAHQKGIVHRDLKPSNILICLYDGKPVPKVIDFGLAKALHQPLTEQSIFTGHGMMVGTPIYMSPEQAELNNLDVDTRTDIYSLGVMLYELLVGSTPLEKAQFKEAAFNEVLRIIKEVEPPRPSTRLSGSTSLPSIAAQRNIAPKQLCKSMSGDLDWIVMKSLEKERTRRYSTAIELSRDIERFLNDDAVEACPPSSLYRLKKFMRKNQGKVIAAALLVAAMILGIGGTTWGMLRAFDSEAKATEAEGKAVVALDDVRNERDAKVRALANEKTQRKLAEKREAEAILAKKNADEALVQSDIDRKDANSILKILVNEGMLSVFEERDGSRWENQRQVFSTIDETLDGRFPDQPSLRFRVRNAMADLAFNLGDSGFAEKLWTRSIDDSNECEQFIENPNDIGDLPFLRNAAEMGMFVRGRKMSDEFYAPTQYDFFELRWNRLLGEQFGIDDNKHIKFELQYQLSKYDLAGASSTEEKLSNESVDLIDVWRSALKAYGESDFFTSSRLMEKTVVDQKKLFPYERGGLGVAYFYLGSSYFNDEKYNLAIKNAEQAIACFSKSDPIARSGDILTNYALMADAYLKAGEPDKAVLLIKKYLELPQFGLFFDSNEKIAEFQNAANLASEAGEDEFASRLAAECIQLKRDVNETDDEQFEDLLNSLGSLKYRAQEYSLAVELFQELLRIQSAREPISLSRLMHTKANLGTNLCAAGRVKDGLEFLESATRHFDKLGTDPWIGGNLAVLWPERLSNEELDTKLRECAAIQADYRYSEMIGERFDNVGYHFWNLNKYSVAATFYKNSHEIHRSRFGESNDKTIASALNHGINLLASDQVADGERVLKKAMSDCTKDELSISLAMTLSTHYAEESRAKDAANLIPTMLGALRNCHEEDEPRYASRLAQFGKNILEAGAFAEAELLLRQTLEIRIKKQPNFWTTKNTQVLLGTCLSEMERTDEAIGLLQAGYSGLKLYGEQIPASVRKDRLSKPIDVLIEIFESQKNAVELEKLRLEKRRLPELLNKIESQTKKKANQPGRKEE